MGTHKTSKKPAAKAAAKAPAERAPSKAPAESSPDGVATDAQNQKLEHTDTSAPETTRDDRLDSGVPMIQGSPDEPTGPEDALGRGPTRGDYRNRVDGEPHESVAVPGGGQLVTKWVDAETGAAASEGAKGAIEVPVDRAPVSELRRQRPRTEEIGDVPGKKGGVETDAEAKVA